MSVIISGTDGLSDVDGSAGTPAIRGTDTNTGIFFGSDVIGFSEGGTECARFNADAQFVAAAGTASLPVLTTTGDLNTGIFFPAADTIAFAEGGVESMRINSSGNLSVGTTGSSGRFTLVGSGATASTTAIFVFNSASAYTFVVNDDGSFYTGATPAGAPYNSTTGTGANLVVTGAGQFQRSTSSLKYKTDVQDATHGLAEVLQLRPVTYKGKNDGQTVFGGLIAEEVHEAGLTEFVQYATDGSPDALSYGNMVSLAFKAIQELKAINDAQASRIETLEAKVAALEAK